MGFSSRPFPTDQRRVVEVVLAGDPAVMLANRGNPGLMHYRLVEPDMGRITVPDDATRVRFRPLQRVERENAETLAGPVPNVGLRVYNAALAHAKAASDAAGRRAAVKGAAADPQADNALVAYEDALARFIDALPEDDQMQVQRFRRWAARRDAEVVRRAVLAVVLSVDGDGVEDRVDAGPTGFPVEDFAAAVDMLIAQERFALTQRRMDASAAAAAELTTALEAVPAADRAAISEALEAGRLGDVPPAVLAALEARREAERIAWAGASDAATIVEEIAHHIERVSSLGKGGLTCSSTQSGVGTATTARPASPASNA